MSTLVKSNGFPTLGTMLEDFWNTDKFFKKSFWDRENLPAVNVKDKKHVYELEMAAPGFKKEDFKVSAENGLLVISAENKNEQKEENENFTRQEFSYSSFTRTFNLPDNIVKDEIKAKYQDGLLRVELKKAGDLPQAKKTVTIE
jgi:HSP20 family protein